MRISGGMARGIPLRVPPGDMVRPATDGLRQAVFSSLGARVTGVCFWDLFAGSGAYGLEALSRGAADGVFVEKNAKAAACMRTNLMAVGKSLGRETADCKIVQADAVAWVARPDVNRAADLVFIDPPYELIAGVAPQLFAGLLVRLAAKPGALVIFEMPGETELTPPGWTCVKRLGGKGARQPSVSFFKKAPAGP
ncbi:MAG TPA: RsmD family RNA methyltransferase [Opitutaceae bacterium]|jgi:16S rRNA (guanine966-N2)-methyltransferase|nr:RsmD family RNA methyltransferase [Opitutaceae bacterium]